MQHVLYVEGHWVLPQRELFNDLGWETFLGPWPTSGTTEPGACSMQDFLEFHNEEGVFLECSLATILEPNAPKKYLLSAKAAQGILRRAAKRGRTLPTHLRQALAALAMDTDRDGTQPMPPQMENPSTETLPAHLEAALMALASQGQDEGER